ncbi:MAG: (2Fe-2S)-binding protein [Planctomycetaceae bacterium]|nr:(2Fe-2S)-binding protein [Planctomycetaceae bacterium]
MPAGCLTRPAGYPPMLNRLTDSFPASETAATRPVCHCLRVEADEIRDAIDDGELNTVRQVTAACGAGGGCTACHRHIKRFLAEAARERAAQVAMNAPAELEPVFGFA